MTDDVAPVVDELTDAIRAALGEDLAGVYLYGSVVVGGFDSGASDIDLLVVLGRDFEEPTDVPGLDRLHRAFVTAHPDWENRLDIVYIGRETLTEFRRGVGDFAVISPGDPFHVRHDPADWLQTWFLAGQNTRVVVGPPADEILPAISRSEFDRAIVDALDTHAARAETAVGGALAYAVLTVSRTLTTISTGGLPTKAEAAVWTGALLPKWAELLDDALACRRSGGTEGFGDAVTRLEARRFIEEVRAAVASSAR